MIVTSMRLAVNETIALERLFDKGNPAEKIPSDIRPLMNCEIPI